VATHAAASAQSPTSIATTGASTNSVMLVSTSTSTSSSASTTSSGYTDGTYTGTGTSKFGNVSVSVDISGGRIAGVAITGTSTTFPSSSIASLPSAVVTSQSANVDVVSGATYASQAFKTAVQQALAQAVAPQVTVVSA